MTFSFYKKGWISTLGINTLLVFVGVVIGIVGLMVFVVVNKPTPKDLEALRLQDTIAYITSEQARLGIDCGMLGSEMNSFMVTAIQPVLDARQPGTDWNTRVNDDTRTRMGELRDHYFACGRLYRAAKNGNWDGLDDLRFSIELDKEVILVNTLIRFGVFGKECGASCLDRNFRDLQEAVNLIINKTSPKQYEAVTGSGLAL